MTELILGSFSTTKFIYGPLSDEVGWSRMKSGMVNITACRFLYFFDVIVSAALDGELPENEMNNKNLDYNVRAFVKVAVSWNCDNTERRELIF